MKTPTPAKYAAAAAASAAARAAALAAAAGAAASAAAAAVASVDSNINNKDKQHLKQSLSTETMLSTEQKNSITNRSLDESPKLLYPSTGNNLIYEPNNIYKIPNLSTENNPSSWTMLNTEQKSSTIKKVLSDNNDTTPNYLYKIPNLST